MLRKFEGTFEAYWAKGEFEPYAATPEQRDRLDHQLSLARGVDPAAASGSGASTAPVWFDLRPYAYQREMLDALAAERSLHQRWRNLVVAATGTGKTVLAAFDLARLPADFPEQYPSPEPPPLLLIAHRKERSSCRPLPPSARCCAIPPSGSSMWMARCPASGAMCSPRCSRWPIAPSLRSPPSASRW